MKISVIIPTFNSENWISRAIRSILNQSFSSSDYEIVVVDDGSKDKTLRILNSFGDKIRLITHDDNRGLPYALNTGIINSQGMFFIRLDSDDFVHEDFLHVAYLFLSLNNEMRAVAYDYYLVDDYENIIKRVNVDDEPIGCGIMFRKDDIISLGLYDKNFLAMEDRDLRERYTEKWMIHRIPLPLYRYRRHDSNMTNDAEKMKKYEALYNETHGCDDNKVEG